MLTRSKSKSADDLNVRNGGRGRGRPKKIVMQQIEEIEYNDEQDDKINENKELENEVNLSNDLSDVDEVTRALESTRINKNGFSLNSIFESMTEAQMDETS